MLEHPGAWEPWGVRALHEFTRREVIELLFLLETKLSMRKLKTVKIHLGMHDCIRVDNEGRGGGLVLTWRDNIEIQLINFSTSHIHVSIKSPEEQQWLFTGCMANQKSLRELRLKNF